jgi:anti-sigma factor (TIGR02949 family)
MKSSFSNWMGSLFRRSKKKVTCCDCLESLQLVVDGEATKEQEQYFMDHLDECLPCYNFYQVEKTVKEVLQSKICKKEVPTHLIHQIRNQLKQS